MNYKRKIRKSVEERVKFWAAGNAKEYIDEIIKNEIRQQLYKYIEKVRKIVSALVETKLENVDFIKDVVNSQFEKSVSEELMMEKICETVDDYAEDYLYDAISTKINQIAKAKINELSHLIEKELSDYI